MTGKFGGGKILKAVIFATSSLAYWPIKVSESFQALMPFWEGSCCHAMF